MVRLHHPWSMLAGEGDGPMAMGATGVTMKMSLYFARQRRYWRAAISLFDAAEAKVACSVFVASKVTALW